MFAYYPATMQRIDAADETRRLQERYARLSEEELQNLAEEGYQLTDEARRLLRAELSRRRLQIAIQNAPPAADTGDADDSVRALESPDSGLVVAHRVWSTLEAERAKAILDAAGIPSRFNADELRHLAAIRSDRSRGVTLMVTKGDQQRAARLLADALPRDPEDEAEYVAVCPQCHSPDIVFLGLDSESETTPRSEPAFNWRCDACGHTWRDEGVELSSQRP